MLENIVSKVNDIVWNPGLVGLLILAGLYFLFQDQVCAGAQVRVHAQVSLQQEGG